MLGNNMVTALSLIGVLVITLGTVLGIIGVATSEWIIFQDNEISHNTTFYNNTFRDTEFHVSQNEDAMMLRRFPHHWPFVWGICGLPVDYPQKGLVRQSFDYFVVVTVNKPSSGRWLIIDALALKWHHYM